MFDEENGFVDTEERVQEAMTAAGESRMEECHDVRIPPKKRKYFTVSFHLAVVI